MEAAAEISQISLAQAEKEDAAALAEARKSMDVFVLEGGWPGARDAGLAAWRKRSGDASLMEVFQGTLPFMLLMLAVLVLVILFPQLSLWLPFMVR